MKTPRQPIHILELLTKGILIGTQHKVAIMVWLGFGLALQQARPILWGQLQKTTSQAGQTMTLLCLRLMLMPESYG
jgi:hypothetical protein